MNKHSAHYLGLILYVISGTLIGMVIDGGWNYVWGWFAGIVVGMRVAYDDVQRHLC